ncbi:MAG: nucleotidyl transferase AbiEii/AbiGii toxin family protein [Bacteroidales bacterium]|nr:nucleotidyl transferase AbiEii/AbiGii toxin family protein [Bacteroidales bacterium]
MIAAETYTSEWINSFKKTKEFNRINPPVLEKMIFALGLLEKLAETGFEFIFKGGTSLVLLLDNFNRLSTDIDIITTKSDEELEKVLSDIVNSSQFTSFEVNKVRAKSSTVPKAHYYLRYDSAFQKQAHIILDVLFEENPYPLIVKTEIKNRWLQISEPITKVLTPDINSILGDKLTAFAPNTVGVPYYRNSNSMSTEIIKQLFDIGILINHVTNIEITHQAFKNTCQNQWKYRNLDFSFELVYQDVFNTALILAKREKNVEIQDKNNFTDLQNGIISFNAFLSNGSFRIENAISASAKAAWFSTILKSGRFEYFIYYNPEHDVVDFEIKNVDFNFLNRFRKTNKEAFYYWYKTLELLNLVNH